MEVVQPVRQRENKVGSYKRIFRVAPIDGVSGEYWSVAEVLETSFTVTACAIDPSDPGHADSGAKGAVPLWLPAQFRQQFDGRVLTDWRAEAVPLPTICKSVRQTPQARTRRRTCPAFIVGFGTSSIASGRLEIS